MNPIEMAFSKVKAWLERHGTAPEFTSDPRFALKCALESIAQDDACGYFHHCGFPCHRLPLIGTGVSSSPAAPPCRLYGRLCCVVVAFCLFINKINILKFKFSWRRILSGIL
jgi:hypothetical protein